MCPEAMATDTHPPAGLDPDLHAVPPPLHTERPAAGRPASPIAQEWVDGYLRNVERVHGPHVGRARARQLGLFLDYAERSSHGAVRLPWWEYSLALEWINARTSGFRLTLAGARRLLHTLRDFSEALVADGRLEDCRDVDQARAVFCGGRTLRLLPRPPRTGAEAWTALHPPEGPLVDFSIADFWLCLLWGHVGHSWEALEERLAAVPGGGGRVMAMHGLRARLEQARVASPARLLGQRTAAADLEEALCWLSEPPQGAAPAAPSCAPDPAVADLTTAQLFSRLGTSFPRMPRAEMEECLRRGTEVLPGCVALLRGKGVAGGLTDPVWAIVVLGELRDPRAVDVLAHWLTVDEETGVAVAAAEALGKIGPRALPLLDATLATGTPTARLYAYGALGMIHTDDAYHRLVAALTHDVELSDVIARALVEHGRREAIEVLHLAGAGAATPPWMQAQSESAMVALLDGPSAASPLSRDWRIRYRRLPGLDWSFPLSWLGIAALTHRHHAEIADQSAAAAPRPLAEIVTDVRLRTDERPCLQCGGRRWEPTGLPLCRHTARGLLALQSAVVERWVAAGHHDVWAALDECDAVDVRLERRPGRRTSPRWAEHERDLIAIGRATLYWLVPLLRQHPDLTLPAVARYLRLLAQDFAVLYGDAQQTPTSPRAPRRLRPKFS